MTTHPAPTRVRSVLVAMLVAVASTRAANAQTAVTVSGHVSANNRPVEGASVRIQELDLGGTTNADGRYSFIVPSSRVRGQTVTLTARHVRLEPRSVSIVLVGGSLVQDFDLTGPATRSAAPRSGLPPSPNQPVRSATPVASAPQPLLALRLPVSIREQRLDSTAVAEAAGPVDLPTALVGRVAGLTVQSDAAPGGSASVLVRGPHSVAGSSQPLYVVDGTPIDNSVITTAAQRFGFGGFDYGTGVQDVNLGDIAAVRVLDGPSAAALYGACGANGVVLVTTKDGRGLHGFEVSASQQLTGDSPLRLPSYQNKYGQGLDGAFEFFDGRGGGVNDAVAESWGPALSGQPVPQASFVEAGQPDVRAWVPQPNNVSGYFSGGRTLVTNAAVQGSNDRESVRLALDNRDYTGLTPAASVVRRGAVLTATATPSAALSLRGNASYFGVSGNDRAGTGFDQINPVAEFARMGRQVDVQTLRTHLRDGTGSQISWNYAGFNNPFFQPLANSNDDHRTRWLGGVGADYALSSSLTASVQAGGDSYDDTRAFSVASGWMGGYPDALGRGSFAGGGSQTERVSVGESNVDAALRFAPGGPASPWSFAAGGNLHTHSVSTDASVVDDTSAVAAPALTGTRQVSASTQAHALYGAARYTGSYASASFVARDEQSSAFASGHDSHVYPAAAASFDLARALAGSSGTGSGLTSATLRAGWSQSGSDPTRYDIATSYAGAQPADSVSLPVAPLLATGSTLAPEITTSIEVGGALRFFTDRAGIDVTYYHDRTADLILPLQQSAGLVTANGGSLTNAGVEAVFDATLLHSPNGPSWRVTANAARNQNTVESLPVGAGGVPLTPTRYGVSLEARDGQPFGVIVGNGFLRNGTGALVLRDGLPLPDTLAGPRVLGSSQPVWTGGLSTRLSYRSIEIAALVDGSFGGKVFSASNMWGATSGALEETAFRPDSGLLIAGVDAATGQPNTQHVSTQDYYHALRAIPERWVYDASFAKLRELRITATIPARWLPGFRAQAVRASLVGRNLVMWAKAPNIDPETALSASASRGLELGELPPVRSVGVQLAITP